MQSLWQIVLGLCALVVGGELLVRNAAALGVRLGLGTLAVGLTIVAFGTSTPELLVSLQASLSGRSDIALGNVVGSNIANILLILGAAALVRPLRVQAQLLRSDVPAMAGASLALLVLLADGSLSRADGIILCICLIGYTVATLSRARLVQASTLGAEATAELPRSSGSIPSQVIFLVGGLVLLVLGARWLVQGAVVLAAQAGIPEAVVGLTLVAVGTSLPELATSLIAAARRHGDIAVGNVVGSNIFNIFGILGLVALLSPIPQGNVLDADLWILVLVALGTLALMRTGFVLTRLEGGMLVAAYAGYLYLLSGRI